MHVKSTFILLAGDLSAMLQPLSASVPHNLMLWYLRVARMFMLVSLLCAVISVNAAVYLSVHKIGCVAIRFWAR